VRGPPAEAQGRAGLSDPDGPLPLVPEARTVPKYTAVFQRHGTWWMGSVEELPGANTQGRSLDEVRENLKEAVSLILEANRLLSRTEAADREVIREELTV